MSIQSDILRGLEEASQKQEKEIVIEFRVDRILHYVGVYLIFVLAAISKVSQLAGNNLSCYPANTTSGADRTFVMYATDYCWESSTLGVQMDGNTTTNTICDLPDEEALLLMNNPTLVKRFVQWMPYIMMLEALLLALPSAWWHLRVGSRLVGHLKFMKLLLNEIYESLKLIKVADFQNTPYDEDSYYLNDWRRYEPGYGAIGKAGKIRDEVPHGCTQTCCTSERKVSNDGADKARSEAENLSVVEMTEMKRTSSTQEQTTEIRSLLKDRVTETGKAPPRAGERAKRIAAKNPSRPQSIFSKIFVGKLLDRHLFSMICYENFSSLEHHPYILSVFQLTRTPSGKVRPDNIPMKQAILRQLCHEKNFTGRFLIHTYVWRHVLGATISLGLLLVMSWVMQLLGPDNWGSESFRCDVIHHANVCMICTMHRKRDMFAMLAVNLAVLGGYFSSSMYQWCFIRASGRRSMAFYFEDISDATSLALEVAYDEEQTKKND